MINQGDSLTLLRLKMLGGYLILRVQRYQPFVDAVQVAVHHAVVGV